MRNCRNLGVLMANAFVLFACGGGDGNGKNETIKTPVVPKDSPIIGDWVYDDFRYVTINESTYSIRRADRTYGCMAAASSDYEITSYTPTSFTTKSRFGSEVNFAVSFDAQNLLATLNTVGSDSTTQITYEPAFNLPYGSCYSDTRTGSISVSFTFNDLAMSARAFDLFDDIDTIRFSAVAAFDVNSSNDLDSGDLALRADFIPVDSSTDALASKLIARLYVYTTDNGSGYFGDGSIVVEGNTITLTVQNTLHPQMQNISTATAIRVRTQLSGSGERYSDSYPDMGLAIGLDSSSLIDSEWEDVTLVEVGLDLKEVNVTINN